MLRALGRFINRLNGLYWTGVDVGTTVKDIEVIRTETPYVVTVSEELGGQGDTSSTTAYGVFQGIRACLQEVYGTPFAEERHGAMLTERGIVYAPDYIVNAGGSREPHSQWLSPATSDEAGGAHLPDNAKGAL